MGWYVQHKPRWGEKLRLTNIDASWIWIYTKEFLSCWVWIVWSKQYFTATRGWVQINHKQVAVWLNGGYCRTIRVHERVPFSINVLKLNISEQYAILFYFLTIHPLIGFYRNYRMHSFWVLYAPFEPPQLTITVWFLSWDNIELLTFFAELKSVPEVL